MQWTDFAWWGLATLVAWFATWRVRAHSLALGVLDVPNARSSHTAPIPRGGGLAIAGTAVIGLVLLGASSALDVRTVLALGVGGVSVGLIGYIDDRRGLSVLPRLSVHIVAATLAVALLLHRADAPLLLTGPTVWPVSLLLVVGVIWSINLFNFMDGIDGIAVSQALFVVVSSGVLIVWSAGSHQPLVTLLAISAGACSGFVLWNWPPARIFMGDVGSGFLGFWVAALAIALYALGVLSLWTSVILNAVFVADSTATLLRRVLHGDRWYEAHRSHAYQILARKWGSHLKVTASLWIMNLAVILPLACISVLWEGAAPWIAVGAVIVLSLGCIALGAGKRSNSG